MKNKTEVLEKIDLEIFKKLKYELAYVYDHLFLQVRSNVEGYSENICTEELTDKANENIHTENMDKYHSDTSTSLGYEEAKEAMDDHEERMSIIKDIYDEKNLKDTKDRS